MAEEENGMEKLHKAKSEIRALSKTDFLNLVKDISQPPKKTKKIKKKVSQPQKNHLESKIQQPTFFLMGTNSHEKQNHQVHCQSTSISSSTMTTLSPPSKAYMSMEEIKASASATVQK